MKKKQIEFEPQWRELNDLIIYFRDKHTVVVSQGTTCVMFHRWFERHLGDYEKKWNPFCRSLKCTNSLHTIWQIIQIAERYGVDHHTISTTIKTLPPKGIKKLPTIHKWKSKKW